MDQDIKGKCGRARKEKQQKEKVEKKPPQEVQKDYQPEKAERKTEIGAGPASRADAMSVLGTSTDELEMRTGVARIERGKFETSETDRDDPVTDANAAK